MESTITHAMLDHLKQNILLMSSQRGFLSKCSTLTAQLSCYNNWLKTLDSGDWIDLITFYYSKAFDAVNHCKLSHTLINVKECNGFLPKGCQDCGILHTCID